MFKMMLVFLVMISLSVNQDSLQAQISIINLVDVFVAPDKSADPKNPEDKDKSKVDLNATHEVVASVKVTGNGKLTLQSVAINSQDIVAGLIGKPRHSSGDIKDKESTQICIMDSQGSVTKQWDLPFEGQALTFGPDDKLYVAGEGKIAIYDVKGTLLKQEALPHLKKIMGDEKSLRQAAIDEWQQSQTVKKVSLEEYQKYIEQLKKNITLLETKIADHNARLEAEKATEESKKSAEDVQKEPTGAAVPAENPAPKLNAIKKTQLERWETELKSTKSSLNRIEKRAVEYTPKEKYTEEEISEIAKSIPGRIGGVRSVAVTKDQIYVVTNAMMGYGYVAWKMNSDLTSSEVFMDKLSGCCSQVDFFANDKGIFMAENTKYRVGYYDKNGKLVTSFGKRARGKDEGFGGCCNPMNAFALSDGTVFCSESAGEIKRFNPDGTFNSLVGKVKLPNDGCKNVSFAVSKDGKKIYFADHLSSKLVILEPVAKKLTQK